MKIHHYDADGINRSRRIIRQKPEAGLRRRAGLRKEIRTAVFGKCFRPATFCVFTEPIVSLHPNSGPCNSQIIILFLLKMIFICPRSFPYQGVLEFLATWWQRIVIQCRTFHFAERKCLCSTWKKCLSLDGFNSNCNSRASFIISVLFQFVVRYWKQVKLYITRWSLSATLTRCSFIKSVLWWLLSVRRTVLEIGQIIYHQMSPSVNPHSLLAYIQLWVLHWRWRQASPLLPPRGVCNFFSFIDRHLLNICPGHGGKNQILELNERTSCLAGRIRSGFGRRSTTS